MADSGDKVSLGEILSVRGDAESAFGSPSGGDAVVHPFSTGIAYLNRTAEILAEADRFKYQEWQKNMQNHFTQFNTIDITGLSPADQKAIGDKYAAVAKLNADNIDVIKNPNKNPAKYSELKQAEADLLKSIAASKMHKSFDDKAAEFIKTNVDWQDINKPKVESSLATSTDDWKPYTLDMPVSYSPAAVAKLVEPIAKQKYAESIAYKGYITEEEGTKIKKQAWDDAWDAIHSSSDPAGRSLADAARKAYEKLPEEARGGTFEEWYKRTRDSLVPQDEVTKKNITADATYNQEQQRILTASEGAKNRAADIKMNNDRIAAGKKNIGVDDVGRLYNEELTGFKTGQFSVAALQNIYGDNAKVTLKSGTKIPDLNNPGATVETSAEVQVPKKVILSSSVDSNGNLVYKYIDYSKPKITGTNAVWSALTGKGSNVENVGGYEVMTSAPVEFKQARTDFYRIIGDEDAGKVADVAEKYRASKKLSRNPDLEELTKYFFPNDVDGNATAPDFTLKLGVTKKITKGNVTLFTNDDGKTFFDKDGKQQF